MSSTLQASIFMGNEYSENLRFIKNTGNDLTMKQMFDISEKLTVGQSDEFYGVTPSNWEDPSWKQLSLVDDEEVISLSHTKVYEFFRFCVMPLKDAPEPTIKYCLGRQIDVVQEFTRIQSFGHNRWWANGIQVEYFPSIHHIASLQQSPRVHVKKRAINQNNLQDWSSSFMSMFNDISCGSKEKDHKENGTESLNWWW